VLRTAAPNLTTPYSLSAIDSVNWIKGTHTVKFGGELRFINVYTDRLGGITYTWASIQNFLSNSLQSTQFLGDLSSPSPFFIPSLVGPAHAKQQYYIGYVQDEWKIKSNLTLNYGLRYEYYTPLKEVNNRQIYFDINTGVLRNPSEDPYLTSGNNFGPRIGLTWSPDPNGTGWFGGGKTVIRGGFGIYYGPARLRIRFSLSNQTASARHSAAAIFRRIPM
jgi:outer membrane receptor protein involved in Fe transport